MVQDTRRALFALHLALVVARKLAYDNTASTVLADVLDTLEILPGMIANGTDQTGPYREMLADLCRHDPMFRIAVDALDNPAPERW